MTVSIRRLSLGAGFAYLMNSVARGDVAGPASSSLTRYYAETGTPPGYWLGAGLAGLGDGAGIDVGSQVSEEQLWRLLGMLQDPVTGAPLGNRPPVGPSSKVVAGFDLTFSVPKSVSTVWALADPATREAIQRAHRDAIAIALRWAEAQIVFTRTGHAGAIQEPVRGVIAAAFDHWDSRAGDPHLHTHVVVANRVQTLDGRWRTLDSKTLHRYAVTLSELHEGVVQDLLSERLGVEWAARPRRNSAVPRHDIAGVPVELMEAFSQRSVQIRAEKDDLVAAFAAQHGRQPTDVEVLRLRQQATLSTRPDKQQRPLAELCDQWRERAYAHIGDDPAVWARSLSQNSGQLGWTHTAIDPGVLAQLAVQALHTVSTKRATFTHANVLTEAHRQLHGIRFATTTDRLDVAVEITDRALEDALLLNAPGSEMSTVMMHKGAHVYSTVAIFDAETRLLDAGRETTAPALPTHLARQTAAANHTLPLNADQAAAVLEIATSGRRVDLLIGPAGTGKTTSLHALRAAWETHHGRGSVLGLAPSAVAAEVLGDSLGVTADNTTKWLLETSRTHEREQKIALLQARVDECSSLGSARAQRLMREIKQWQKERDRWCLQPGQLLIVDEASLASTTHLDQLTAHVMTAGAKVLLVGDPMQLGAVDAGGAFAMLARDRDRDSSDSRAAELGAPRRFAASWEREASLLLREGDHAVVDAYVDHGRVTSGARNDALNSVLERWQIDTAAGLQSLMIAGDRDTVTDLNLRARAALIQAGIVASRGVPIATGAAGVGDEIITRHNDRTLRHDKGWVRNGDTWAITATHNDGSLTATNTAGSAVGLDADYVRNHVDLGYATNAYLAQGRTVDTTYVLVDDTTSREALYVAATRGRQSNSLTVVTDDPTYSNEQRDILTAALDRRSADLSAHETRDQAGEREAQEAMLVATAEHVQWAVDHRQRLESGNGIDF